MPKHAALTLPLTLLASISFSGCDDAGDPRVRLGDPEISAAFDENDCRTELTFALRVTGADPPESLAITISLDEGADGTIDEDLAPGEVLSGSAPDLSITAAFALGEHRLLVDASDAAGALGSAATDFEVVDTRAPAPICINGLAIELMPTAPGTDADGDGDLDDGAMTLSATDFVASPASDCSEPIVFSIGRAGAPANVDQAELVLTCDDLGTVLVDVSAWDGAGNHDFCESYVLVQDNMTDCSI